MRDKLERLKEYFREKTQEEPFEFWFLNFFILFVFLFCLNFFLFLRAPSDFPEQSIFDIEKGSTLNQIAEKMEEENFVRSSFWLKNAVILLQGEEKIKGGEYFFEKSESTFEIARRIIAGEFDLTPIRVTLHEGLNIFEIAEILEKEFPKFNKEEFLEMAKEKEGYLFPDTYFFTPNSETKEFIEVMENNFYEKIKTIWGDVLKFDKSLDDIVKMASIVETESRTEESRKIISGILWKRLEIGMPLQVDVTFKYINGKNSSNLTQEDLELDSPYNTYEYKGLPPTPISNPGLDAIEATINPEETDYLFFLADKTGTVHYAITFDEHVENKKLFLRN